MEDKCKKELKPQNKYLERTSQETKVKDLKESYELGKEYYENITKNEK